MKKNIICLIFIFLVLCLPSFAEKIPVKITPIQLISTHYDNIEVGDKLAFQVVNDVYVKNKLFIKKGENIWGIVDFVHNNGWAGDSAEIKLEKFITKNVDGERIIINSNIRLDGNTETANSTKQIIASKILVLVRGSEIFIEPDTITFNIFIER